jgi:hypothetical protein
MNRLGEIWSVIGTWPDLTGLERHLASLTQTQRAQLAAAVEAERSHFLSTARNLRGRARRIGRAQEFICQAIMIAP